jgi:hypothetical protein
MTLPVNPRRIAAALMRAALRFAPPAAAEWGRAMLLELHYVEGDWPALAWAIGGAGVLARQTLLALMFPGSAGQLDPPAGKFFSKENPVRKRSLIAAAACLAASLLFFAAPTFREAFQISVNQWRDLIGSLFNGGYTGYRSSGVNLLQIAERAKANRDAGTLAFVAIHRRYEPDAPALAEEAVRLDPQLTWVYAVLGVANLPQSTAENWIAALKQFDPDNAVPYLLQAQLAQSNEARAHEFGFQRYLADPAWLNAISAAFASSKIDTYGQRVKDLDRKVASANNISDPYQAQREYFLTFGMFFGVGAPADYVRVLVKSGDELAARGDDAGAEKQYRLAAHFGEMLDAAQRPGADSFRTPATAAFLLEEPYHRLAALYEKEGDRTQSEYFRDQLGAAIQQRQASIDVLRAASRGTAAERWNADILGIAGITLFLCAALIPICAIITVIKSRSVRPSRLQISPRMAAFGWSAFTGLFVSTAALYFSYRPYAQIVRAYFRDGDSARLLTLGAFLDHLNYNQTPPQHQVLYSLWTFPMYFWAGVIVLCAAALLFTAAKFIADHRNPTMMA